MCLTTCDCLSRVSMSFEVSPIRSDARRAVDGRTQRSSAGVEIALTPLPLVPLRESRLHGIHRIGASPAQASRRKPQAFSFPFVARLALLSVVSSCRCGESSRSAPPESPPTICDEGGSRLRRAQQTTNTTTNRRETMSSTTITDRQLAANARKRKEIHRPAHPRRQNFARASTPRPTASPPNASSSTTTPTNRSKPS